jgi:hypothetical protein
MNTVNVFKDSDGNVVGMTTNPSVGISISSDSSEFQSYIAKINQPSVLSWDQIRAQRNFLLSQTDWIFAPDVTLKNKEDWLTYRQALRDLPSKFSKPEEVVWPEKPH